MNKLLSISIADITADIYARSALHHLDPDTTTTLLTNRSAAAIDCLIADEIDSLALMLDAIADRIGSTVTFTLDIAADAPETALASALQRYIALRILAEAVFTTEQPYAASLLESADSTLSSIRRFVNPQAASNGSSLKRNLPRIKPHCF